MSEPLSPEIEQKAQELAARIKSRSADAILDMAGYFTSAIDCPQCGRSALFHCYRESTVEALGGAVTCNRAYDYSRSLIRCR